MNVAVFGICEADALTKLPPGLSFARRAGGIDIPRDFKTVIVCGLSYARALPDFPADEPRGIFSIGACGEDYHITVSRLLEILADKQQYILHVDKGVFDEQEAFIRAGLGFRGRHNLVINEELGSFFNIGLLFTNAEVNFLPRIRKQKENACGDCRLCIDACPTGAITDGNFNYTKCRSYLTQKKGELSPSERTAIGNHLYGCDICQNFCPHNKNKAQETLDANEVYPRLSKILRLTKQDFERDYKTRACYWRGLNTLKRNAEIAIKNS